MYNFRNFLSGRGPYPFLNAFCATRDHLDLSGLRPTRPPWLILRPRKVFCFTFTPSQVSYSWKKSYLKRSHSLCPLRAQWWSRFFLLTELLLRTVHIKHYYGFIWNLPCPAATPTFFTRFSTTNNRTTWGSHSDTVWILKILIWFFLPFFAK